MSIGTVLQYFGLIIGGFLLGGIMFSWFVPSIIKNIDICDLSADHNPGSANVFTSCGWKMGLLCLLLDMAKGFIPVFSAYRLLELNTDNLLFAAVMTAPIMGHAIAPFCKKGGGKCIAPAFGVMVALLPTTRVGLILAALYISLSTVARINPIRIRSIITFAIFGVLSEGMAVYNGRYAIGLGCILISLTVIVKHLRRFCVMQDTKTEINEGMCING